MATARFRNVVTSVDELRALIKPPSEPAIKKDIGVIDAHCRAFIGRSPFMLLATAGASGRCDVSPKGDAPGFVQVLDDHTLLIPDRPGNRRLDSLQNIIKNPHVGLIFIVPGVEDTLRVNGGARIIRDDDVLARCAVEGKAPVLGIAVDVEEAYLHCPKCFRRSRLWDTETWPARSELPSTAQMAIDQLRVENVPISVVEQAMEEANRKLY